MSLFSCIIREKGVILLLMAKFFYDALKDNTQFINGEVEAIDLREARAKIRELGYMPTKVYQEETNNQHIAESPDVSRLSLGEKIHFTNELQILLSSSIPIIESLDSIEMNTPKKKLQIVAKSLSKGLKNGQTFSEALNKYSKVFGPVYMGLCVAGEASGGLDKTLSRMVELLRKEDDLKGKIIQAMMYPCFLVLVMIGLFAIMPFILSQFLGVMSGSGAELPMLARGLLNFSLFINHYWWLCLMFIVGGIYGLNTIFSTSKVKKSWDNFILKIPVICEFVRFINLSNFIAVLHVSYEAGVPILECLRLSNNTIKNNNMKKQVNNSIELIKKGTSLSDAFSRTDIMPGPILMLISTGEKSGQLGKMLKDATDVIDKKLDMIIQTMAKLFEPTMIVIMGSVVALFAVAFYQAYYGMLNTLF